MLTLEDDKHCREAQQLGSKKLATVRERVVLLRRVEEVLAVLLEQCHCNTGKVRSPLIAALENGVSGATEQKTGLSGRV